MKRIAASNWWMFLLFLLWLIFRVSCSRTGDDTLPLAKSHRKLQSQNELTCCTTALQTLTSAKLRAHSAHSTRTLPEKLYTKRIVRILCAGWMDGWWGDATTTMPLPPPSPCLRRLPLTTTTTTTTTATTITLMFIGCLLEWFYVHSLSRSVQSSHAYRSKKPMYSVHTKR